MGFGAKGAPKVFPPYSSKSYMTTAIGVNSLVQPLGEMPPEAIVFGRTDNMRAVR